MPVFVLKFVKALNTRIPVWALILAGIALGIMAQQMNAARERARINANAADSVAAAYSQMLRLNTNTWTRLALVTNRIGELEGQLVKAQARVKTDTIYVRDTTAAFTPAAVQDSTDLTGTLERPPVHVAATVQIRPGRARWLWDARVDPVDLTISVTCNDGTPSVFARSENAYRVGAIAPIVAGDVCRPPRHLGGGFPWKPVAAVSTAAFLLTLLLK